MAASRKAVWNALAAMLTTRLGSDVKKVSRRLKGWADTPSANRPAVYISQLTENPEREPGEPQRRVWNGVLTLIVNSASDTEGITSDAIDDLMDLVDAAMKPDQNSGRQTLGGLVRDCRVVGNMPIFEGDIDGGDTYAHMPIKIVMQDDQEGSTLPFFYGAGYVYLTPKTAMARAASADPTPIRVGALMDSTVTGALPIQPGEVGQYRLPTRFATKSGFVKIHTRMALMDGRLIDQILFGAVRSTGATLMQPDVTATIPAGLTITPTVPNGGTWSADLGVLNATTGAPLTFTTGAPTTGQYAVTAGVYTFAAADVGVSVSISYEYTTASGTSLAVPNLPMGEAWTCSVRLMGQYNGRQVMWKFNQCATAAFSLVTGQERFSLFDITFEVMGDTSDQIGTLSVL